MAFHDLVLKALQDVVGEENATCDPVTCQAYSRVQWTPDGIIQRNQIGVAMRPACVVLPGTTEEVQAVYKLANRYGFPVIPRGSGMINCAFPNREGTVVIDGRMDRTRGPTATVLHPAPGPRQSAAPDVRVVFACVEWKRLNTVRGTPRARRGRARRRAVPTRRPTASCEADPGPELRR